MFTVHLIQFLCNNKVFRVLIQGDAENVFHNRDVTISLMRNTCNEDECVRGGNFIAVAHFNAEIEDEARSAPTLTLAHKGTDTELKECKFDTLTFEQLGGIVRLPIKRTTVRNYENCEPKQLKISQCEMAGGDPFYFPSDVFDHDVVFVELPGKV